MEIFHNNLLTVDQQIQHVLSFGTESTDICIPDNQCVNISCPAQEVLGDHLTDVVVTNVEVAELRAKSKGVSGKGGDLVAREAEGPEGFGKAGEGVNADTADVVIRDVEIMQILELVDGF